MKKILSILILTGSFLPFAVALGVIDAPTLAPHAVLENVANFIFWILLFVAVIMLIAAGVMFVMAAGNPEGVSRARALLMYAIIGLAVAVMARGLVWFYTNYISAQQVPGI